jgi:hypothetical protein
MWMQWNELEWCGRDTNASAKDMIHDATEKAIGVINDEWQEMAYAMWDEKFASEMI